MAASLFLLSALTAAAQSNGIFADFTTSKGDFTVQLNYERAPAAVASFVGLATGEITWLDPDGNTWNKPFYDGSIFHRIVTNNANGRLAIQGGGIPYRTANTTNFANAGFYIFDSFNNGLLHSNGVISMANSGPNTDGSQFFITTTNAPVWNGGYTVFGNVVTGMNTVAAISQVALGGASRPLADVVLQRVAIRRVGTAAQNFDIRAHGLPAIGTLAIGLGVTNGNMKINFEVPRFSEVQFRMSTNGLRSWNSEELGYFPAKQTIEGTLPMGEAAFFSAPTVAYSNAWTAPFSPTNRIFRFIWTNVSPMMYYNVMVIGTSGIWAMQQGSFTTNGNLFTGPLAPQWRQFPWSANLNVADNYYQHQYTLRFDPGKGTNTFTGTAAGWTGGGGYISGTFTCE